MNQEFAGKVVIITGSSGGIGRAAAIAFARLGAGVTIHGQSEAKLAETHKMLIKEAGLNDKQIASVLGPIEREETAKELIEKTIQKFGRIDVLVNNAGAGKKLGVEDINSLDNFDYLFAVNVRAVIYLTQLATPHLAKTEGNVVMISSGLSVLPTKGNIFYGMTKAALDHYTRDMANVLGQQKIRVNGINPGLIPTEFRTRHGVDFNKLNAIVTPRTIAKRAGTVEEIAEVITFLASPRASYIWGANIFVDGGGTTFAEF